MGPIIDDATGEYLHDGDDRDLRGLVTALEAKCAGLEADLMAETRRRRAVERKNKMLEDEAREAREGSPEMAVAKAIFRYWVDKTQRDAKRTKFGDKRQSVVLARLREGHAPERIMRAVDWVAMRPFVTDAGRATTGKATQRFDELELVCRNEVNVERFARLADAIDPGGGLTEAMPVGV